MIMVNIGGMQEHYSPTGINGPIDDLLWPINHGTLFYTGFEILPSFITYRANRVDADAFKILSADLHQRLTKIPTAQPIPYRKQNFGQYSIPLLELKPELMDEKKQGLGLHIKSP
jgi:NAD(P)H dehydrogenase (quinone)